MMPTKRAMRLFGAVSTDKGKSFSKPIRVGPPGLIEAWDSKIDVGDTGKIALAYIGSTTSPGKDPSTGVGPEYTMDVSWNGYITTSVNATSKNIRLRTTSVNPLSDPIERGECCEAQGDFIDVVIGPGGRPWTSMIDACWPPPGDACDPLAAFIGTV